MSGRTTRSGLEPFFKIVNFRYKTDEYPGERGSITLYDTTRDDAVKILNSLHCGALWFKPSFYKDGVLIARNIWNPGAARGEDTEIFDGGKNILDD